VGTPDPPGTDVPQKRYACFVTADHLFHEFAMAIEQMTKQQIDTL